MLDIAVGVFLALAAMRLVDHALELHRDKRRVAMFKETVEPVANDFIDKMHAEMKAEQEAMLKPKPVRRKPAARKAPVKKTVAKKGVQNVRRNAKR